MAETSKEPERDGAARDAEDWQKTWPFLPFCDASVLRKCKAYPVSNDIFICSFPKSGTTWMQNMVYTLMTKGQDRSFGQISDVAPFFEHRRTWAETETADAEVPSALSKRVITQTAHMTRKVFNTHLLWDLLPNSSPDARFIYVVRQGEDAMVSFHHHLSNQVEGGYEGDFASFFEASLKGEMAFGRWTDHLASFFPILASGDPRILSDPSPCDFEITKLPVLVERGFKRTLVLTRVVVLKGSTLAASDCQGC